jgi:hypothetical protein
LAAFALIDLPQTVGLKALFVRLLPLEPESTNATIRKLCDNAYAGSSTGTTTCYLANHSEAAAQHVRRRGRCEEFKRNAPQTKDWSMRDAEMLLYIGSENELAGWFFWPEKCVPANMRGETREFRGD